MNLRYAVFVVPVGALVKLQQIISVWTPLYGYDDYSESLEY